MSEKVERLKLSAQISRDVEIGLQPTIGLGDVAVFENRQPVTAAE